MTTLARADRADRGLRRPRRPAHRALAVLQRAAARRAAHRRPARRPLHRAAGSAIAEEMDADPSPRRDRRALRRRVQPLRARRARLRERPALRADLPAACTRGRSRTSRAGRRRDPQARARDAGQNPHLQVHVAYGYYDGATPHFAAEDVLAHLQIPHDAAREHRARVLRGRPHDVRPRAEPAPAVPRPGGLRAARRRLSLASRHLRVLPGGPWGDTEVHLPALRGAR